MQKCLVVKLLVVVKFAAGFSVLLRKRQLHTLRPLPNDKFCQAPRFLVPRDQRQPGSLLEGSKREDPGNAVVDNHDEITTSWETSLDVPIYPSTVIVITVIVSVL